MGSTGRGISAPTQTLRANDVPAWGDIVSHSFTPVAVTAPDEEHFHAQIRSRAMGGIFLSEISAESHLVERTAALTAASPEKYYKLSLQLSGVSLLMQDNREAVLQPGDIAIYDTERPYSLLFEEDFRLMVVMFPHSLIDLPAETIGQLTSRRIAGHEGLAGMVGPFLTGLAHDMERISGHSGLRLLHNTLDLVTTVLRSQLDSDVNPPRNPRAALVEEIRAYIDDHLDDPELSPGEIAAANYISTRHLHGVFKEEGVTVSAWIRELRLEHCRRDLADPLFARMSVSAVAARWGFMDASHFSRLFRSTFGEAPTDFRMRAWAELEVSPSSHSAA